MQTLTPSTPQERLANSRKALLRLMTRQTHGDRTTGPARESVTDDAELDPHATSVISGSWSMLKTALRAWWRHHPVSLALQVAQPLLGQYARDQPFKLLAVSAGVGAAAVVLRPWRVVSLGGMLMAALKPSELSGAMLSLLSSSRPSSAHLKEHHETND